MASQQKIRPREEEQFLRFLRGRGLRVTAARRALCAEIFAQHGHIDADEVHRAVRAAGHSISRATIYRNLDLLVAAGLVHKVRLGGQRTVFEHVHAGGDHDHMACRRCGRIVEFVSPGIQAMLGEICRAHGFSPAESRLQILGLCRDCLEVAAPEPARSVGEMAHV